MTALDSRSMSVHSDKIESVLIQAIQEVLGRGLHDPRVRGMISVTRIQLSSDYAYATVFVSIMPRDRESLTMHGLQAAAAHLRRQVAGRVRLRRMPELAFKLDRSLKAEAEILRVLREDEDDLQRITGRKAPETPVEGEDS